MPAGHHTGGGCGMRWCLALLVFLARVAGCDGDAPTLSARVERVGALTFVVAMNVSASDVVRVALNDLAGGCWVEPVVARRRA